MDREIDIIIIIIYIFQVFYQSFLFGFTDKLQTLQF